ncbi:MAG TPA: CBS domain-containing protein [Bacteriovoracaceae bacterium]|nr:CBS domain-containing protein [Bacteriovoracaceae bacterium]
MQVSEIMHQGVQTVKTTDSIRDVAKIMKDFDIGSVPVYEESNPVGFVTDRDIVIGCVAEGSSTDAQVSEAMTPEFVCVEQNSDISDAARLMKDRRLSRIVVVDEKKQAVGIVTLQDISNNLTDEKLKGEILSEIKH